MAEALNSIKQKNALVTGYLESQPLIEIYGSRVVVINRKFAVGSVPALSTAENRLHQFMAQPGTPQFR